MGLDWINAKRREWTANEVGVEEQAHKEPVLAILEDEVE